MEKMIEVSFERGYLKNLEKDIRLEISRTELLTNRDKLEIEHYKELIQQKEKNLANYSTKVAMLAKSLEEIESKIYSKGE